MRQAQCTSGLPQPDHLDEILGSQRNAEDYHAPMSCAKVLCHCWFREGGPIIEMPRVAQFVCFDHLKSWLEKMTGTEGSSVDLLYDRGDSWRKATTIHFKKKEVLTLLSIPLPAPEPLLVFPSAKNLLDSIFVEDSRSDSDKTIRSMAKVLGGTILSLSQIR